LTFRTTSFRIAEDCTRVPFAPNPYLGGFIPEGNIRVTAPCATNHTRVFLTLRNARKEQTMTYAYPSKPFGGPPPYTARPRAGETVLLFLPSHHSFQFSLPVRVFVKNVAIRAISFFQL
jgi:hypothetical protein